MSGLPWIGNSGQWWVYQGDAQASTDESLFRYPNRVHGERLAGEVLGYDLANGGDPRGIIRAGDDHAVRANGRHCPRR